MYQNPWAPKPPEGKNAWLMQIPCLECSMRNVTPIWFPTGWEDADNKHTGVMRSTTLRKDDEHWDRLARDLTHVHGPRCYAPDGALQCDIPSLAPRLTTPLQLSQYMTEDVPPMPESLRNEGVPAGSPTPQIGPVLCTCEICGKLGSRSAYNATRGGQHVVACTNCVNDRAKKNRIKMTAEFDPDPDSSTGRAPVLRDVEAAGSTPAPGASLAARVCVTCGCTIDASGRHVCS